MISEIQTLQDDFEIIPEPLKDVYSTIIETGFTDWNLADYKQFLKAFLKCDLNDIEAIAAELVESKTIDEVVAYHLVFSERY